MPTAMLGMLADFGSLSVQIHHAPCVFAAMLVVHHSIKFASYPRTLQKSGSVLQSMWAAACHRGL